MQARNWWHTPIEGCEHDPKHEEYLGTIELYRVPHHVQAIPVLCNEETDWVQLPECADDPYWDDLLQAYSDTAYRLVKIPQFPGKEFALLVVPYGD